MKTTVSKRVFVTLILSVGVFGCSRTGVAGRNGALEASTSDQSQLVGTWEGGAGDGGASSVVILELHPAETYTKTLRANVYNLRVRPCS